MQAASLVLLSQQHALQRAMDVVANNIANSNTTGFKRTGVEFDTMTMNPQAGQSLNFVVDRATYRDTAPGPIQPTGNTLDFAIKGAGYFEVMGADNKVRYTRNGAFQLNNQGQLTNLSGLPVLSDGGAPITLPDTTTEINISNDGFVTARIDHGTSLAEVGKIAVVKIDNQQAMQAEGADLYTTNETPTPIDNSSGVVQGALEHSNVQSVTEMTDMIKIYRSYEQATNLISQENSRLNDAITKLSKTTV